jgi:RNA recognition motif-containing protein
MSICLSVAVMRLLMVCFRYAYVEFLEVEAVQNAILLSESELHGRQLKVGRSVHLNNALLESQTIDLQILSNLVVGCRCSRQDCLIRRLLDMHMTIMLMNTSPWRAGHSKTDERSRNEGISWSSRLQPLFWVPPAEALSASLWVCSLWLWVGIRYGSPS